MTVPAQQAVINQVAAWLEKIRLSNGYHSEAGLHVQTEELDDIEDPPRVSLLVLDEAATAPGRAWTLELTIEAVLHVEPDNARAEARKVVTDVRQALAVGAASRTFDTRLIRAVRTQRIEIPRRIPGENLLAATVNVEVEYHDSS